MVYGSLMEGNILELESVQKESEVFYAKYSREFDYQPRKIFETGEVFFADKNNNIYIVLIKIFDEQPLIKEELSSEINKWLFSLKFIK